MEGQTNSRYVRRIHSTFKSTSRFPRPEQLLQVIVIHLLLGNPFPAANLPIFHWTIYPRGREGLRSQCRRFLLHIVGGSYHRRQSRVDLLPCIVQWYISINDSSNIVDIKKSLISSHRGTIYTSFWSHEDNQIGWEINTFRRWIFNTQLK